MKKNFPVSGIEKPFTSGLIVSRTDLKGIIRHVNDAFVELSGFTREELLGQSHNIVRHPEMPPVLFEDLWNTLKQNQPWRGLVKNRCQNGDHYWVDALVVPVRERGQVTGYMSVRTPASREGVRQAEALYPRLLNGEKFKKPKRPGINEQPVRWLAASLLALSLIGSALLPPGLWANLTALFGLLTLGGLMLFERQRAARQQRLLDVCERIAEGRLDNELVINGKGENGRLETALAGMQVHLKVVIDDLQMTARALEGDSRQLTASLHDIFQRIEASNGNIEQICAAVEQLSASIEQVARHAGDTATLSQSSSQTIRQSSGDILQAREQSEAAARTVGDAQETIRSLSDAIADVGKVTQTIHDIAEQTNLLALNAAIEAARAGETGRGFAVVADEVRKLAERTSSSTDEIKSLVASIRKASDDTVSAMLKVNSETQAGTEAQQRTATQLETIQTSAEDVRRMMEEVAGTNTQQSETANHLSERMADIAHQLGETHRHIDHAHGTVTGFADKAKSLSKLAGHFQLQAD